MAIDKEKASEYNKELLYIIFRLADLLLQGLNQYHIDKIKKIEQVADYLQYIAYDMRLNKD